MHAQAGESHDADIAREGRKGRFKQKQHGDVVAGLLPMAANYFLVFSWCQTRLDA